MLYSLGLLVKCSKCGFPSDPNAGHFNRFYAFPGLAIRLTRNLDKERGFVNGAMGHVETILAYDDDTPIVFTVRLSATGVLVLVHPIWHEKQRILPCTYGYATTIRRAQGATYHHGCLYFDHTHPPDHGYGYVGASRFKSKGGLYLYGQIRRTDFIPVHAGRDRDAYQYFRGEESESDYDSDNEEHKDEEPKDEELYGYEDEAEVSDVYGSDSTDSMNCDDREECRRDIEDFFARLRTMRGAPENSIDRLDNSIDRI